MYGPGGHYLPHYDVLQGHDVTYNDNGIYIGIIYYTYISDFAELKNTYKFKEGKV